MRNNTKGNVKRTYAPYHYAIRNAVTKVPSEDLVYIFDRLQCGYKNDLSQVASKLEEYEALNDYFITADNYNKFFEFLDSLYLESKKEIKRRNLLAK